MAAGIMATLTTHDCRLSFVPAGRCWGTLPDGRRCSAHLFWCHVCTADLTNHRDGCPNLLQ